MLNNSGSAAVSAPSLFRAATSEEMPTLLPPVHTVHERSLSLDTCITTLLLLEVPTRFG